MKTGEISYCGIVCSDCPPMIMPLSSDLDEIEKGEQWVFQDRGSVQGVWQNTQCEGCKSDILAELCVNCAVRGCAEAKGIDNCAECERYLSCKILANVHHDVPEAKIRLDKVYARVNVY